MMSKAPLSLSIQIFMFRPSGYCGAQSWICQSGRK